MSATFHSPPRRDCRRHDDAGTDPAMATRLLIDTLEPCQPQGRPIFAALADGPPGTLVQGLYVRSLAPDSLTGWYAPADVLAVGVVATGRAWRPADDSAGRPARGVPYLAEAAPGCTPAEGESVRIVVAVARDGSSAGRLQMGGAVTDDPPQGGRMHDSLRRALGLPTDPPPVPASHLLASLWLGALEAATQQHRGPALHLTWAAALALHPVASMYHAEVMESEPFDDDVFAPDPPSEEELAAVVRASADVWTWEGIRTTTALEGRMAGLCPPELAAWMDDGMFARWVLSGFTPLPVLVRRVQHRLAPEVHDALTGLLAECGVDLA